MIIKLVWKNGIKVPGDLITNYISHSPDLAAFLITNPNSSTRNQAYWEDKWKLIHLVKGITRSNLTQFAF